ncbi:MULTISPECIES: amino acid adenylation domain-containing protein [unclassified Nostoc]|uniref:non-ribosomal peptide synthetase family protein n=1 Tax=unclassified Nostoc TaxID=2593658 RepID=UPI002AD581A0|nr:amino acid adenylation domain-containing protein [Nostoc sp. DedQUE03]MDZ7975465.1 amino acid adenylation domain-containing protein [Nostoc sp. DedQUE03]MDZ8045513.1 amino acid adenylation domain-containing protein [Nostoc sp. DedQUE02]
MQVESIEGFRLSPQQEHLWLLQQIDKSSAYRSDCAILIEGNINVNNLELALQDVVNRYEILRTSFVCLPGMTIPVQVITDSKIILDKKSDISNLKPQELEAQIELIFQKIKQQNFELEKGSILNTYLVTISPNKYLLFISLPALCADSATLNCLVRELALSYLGKLDEELSEEPLQYADFSEWQNQILEAEETKIGREYWQQQDYSTIGSFQLPFENRPSNQQKFQPKLVDSVITPELVANIETLAHKYNTSASNFYLTCWLVLLWRLSGQSEMNVAKEFNGRKYEELKGALGLFAKYLPLHCHLEDIFKFSQVLQQVHESVESIDKWQECFTWEQISEGNNKSDILPFLPVGFEFTEEDIKHCAGNISFSISKLDICTERFKVKLSCKRKNGFLNTEFHYDSNLFSAQDIAGLAEQFHKLVESATYNSEARISELEILSDRTLHQLLFEFNQTQADYPQNKCIHQLFTEQVERIPDNIAIVFNNQQLTYTELNARANQLAHSLQKLGVGAEVLVGICVERSLEMLVGILGILKAGGAYVPLDPHYPQERLAFMLEDTQVSILLTQQYLLENLPKHDAQTICLDTDWEAIAQQSQEEPVPTGTLENLAYVIYTSGSTGKPKGVAIAHRNLVHSTIARITYYQEPISSFLLLSSFAFDSSIVGIFWTLCCGGTLHLPEESVQKEVSKIVELIYQNGVSHLLSLPSLYALILQQAKLEQLNSLRAVIVAGEACLPELVQLHFQLQPETSLFNEYGPTEATVWSSVYHCHSLETGTQISIGCPIANTKIYILDSHLHPVPVGVPGEIYISGEGLARGYLNQPAITSEKFIPHPFSQQPGIRLYKTGDLARYLSNGNIDFLGRIDNQVKIRGFRIELGEIEALLNQHPGVQEIVVIAREDIPGNKRLVAYVVPLSKSATTVNELRNFAKDKLPEFMVPSAIVLLKELPLSPNGKVDRKTLPAPEQVRSDLIGEFVPPRTPVEEMLTQIWSEVLKVEKVGIYDNFFELGGHSLLTTQLLAKVKATFNLDISLRSLLEKPTVEGLSENIDRVCQTEVNYPTLDIKTETILDETISSKTVGKFISEPNAILLTGATGFLGAFLLAELLQQTKADIYCLVRYQNFEYSNNKLQNTLESYGIWNEIWSSRIIPIIGDLSKPLLGLETERFQQLASTIDVIYHNGAWVHHIYPYSILKPANVLGTQEILRLASQTKTKPVHFISSSGVVSSQVESGVKIVREQDRLNEKEFPSNGYCQTKWVAEKLVQTAAERGIPISIYRPSRISGHSQTGVFNSNDFLYKLIIGCVQLGSAPDIDIKENIVPVDYVSKAIVHLSKQEESLGKTFHLVHPQTLHSNTLIEHIRSWGYSIEQNSYEQWREKLVNVSQGSLEHPLYSLVPFFPARQAQEENSNSGFLQLDNQNVIDGLVETSITCPSLDNQLLSVYISYLIRQSYLDRKV